MKGIMDYEARSYCEDCIKWMEEIDMTVDSVEIIENGDDEQK